MSKEEWDATRWVPGSFSRHEGDWDSGLLRDTGAEIRGPFAVHDGKDQPRGADQSRARWILSHIPSGCFVFAFAKRKQAKDAADHMVRLAGGTDGWEALDQPAIGHELRDVARQAIGLVDPASAKARWPDFAEARP